MRRLSFVAIYLAALLLIAVPGLCSSELRQIGMVSIPGAPGFGELAFANGMLVMPHAGSSTVDVFDPVRRRVVAQISGLQSPRGVAVDEANGRVFVADHGNNSIAIRFRFRDRPTRCCSMAASCTGLTPTTVPFL
jgi:hypothetical protein